MNEFDEHGLTLLPVKAPEILEKAVGYTEGRRWFYMYWTPLGDEVIVGDGFVSHDGNPWNFLVFANHPAIAPHLQPYNIGDSDTMAEHAILVDTHTRNIYVDTAKESARRFEQAVQVLRPIEEQGVVFENFDAFQTFAQTLFENLPAPDMDAIASAMMQDAKNGEVLQAQLDAMIGGTNA